MPQEMIHVRIVEDDDWSPDPKYFEFAKQVLSEIRKNRPPISYEQMVAELEIEVVLYALQQLHEQNILTDRMYHNAIEIALKKMKKEMLSRGLEWCNRG